jgi:CheY-specific phosphatase CheX
MKTETIQEHLREAISEVMETMFFLPVQFLDGPEPLGEWLSVEKKVMEALIEFEGARAGRVFLLVPHPALKEMAANFLGLEEEEVSEEHAEDTLKEAINMMTGRMLSMLSREGGCALLIPRFAGVRNPADLGRDDDHGFVLLFETGKNHLAAGMIEPRT